MCLTPILWPGLLDGVARLQLAIYPEDLIQSGMFAVPTIQASGMARCES